MKESFSGFEDQPSNKNEDMVEQNTLHREHLKEGVPPIIACVGKECEPELKEENVLNVDFLADTTEQDREKILHGGMQTYAVSPVDSRSKESKRFVNCLGIIVCGVDRKTGENISFLGHQDPQDFLLPASNLLSSRINFLKDLRSLFNEIKSNSEEKSIDAVIFGGNYYDYQNHERNYLEAIKLLDEEVKEGLNFAPVVITGPKDQAGIENILFDNKNRRLYINRDTEKFSKNNPYLPQNILKEKEAWENKLK